MHVYFSGIGGTGIGPLALIAKQAGYEVSGSDKQNSQYIEYLKKKGIKRIHIGQSQEQINQLHQEQPIDWLVYSSAAAIENSNHPEIVFAKENKIKNTKRDEFLNQIINDHNLKLLAIAGTHGKTTTTAMVIWLFKELGIPISYSVGAKISFGEMGHYDDKSEYFVLECDEFDHNFLSFKPKISLISGIGYDHHEIYPTEQSYLAAFRQFIKQSQSTILWQEDDRKLNISSNSDISIQKDNNPEVDSIKLPGLYNRRDAWLAVQSLLHIDPGFESELIKIVSKFPGVSRRFEKIRHNLYTDYAHTPEKILAAMNVAKDSASPSQKIVVVYEPLTNRRMHYTAREHKDIFAGADKIYWVPSYLAREDPNQKILSPAELIHNLNDNLRAIAEPMELNQDLQSKIDKHLDAGDMVLAFSGGGGHSLDEWLRQEFGSEAAT